MSRFARSNRHAQRSMQRVAARNAASRRPRGIVSFIAGPFAG